MQENHFEMIAKTLYGLEDVLAEELTALQAEEVQIGHRMVSFKGDKAMMYKANLHCRTALRILMPLCHFKADNADTVYTEVIKIEWDKYLSPAHTFVVDAVINSESFNHSKYVAYRTKDAIVDYFNEKYDKRPSVRLNRPDLYIHIHISHRDCTVSLDSSGESLHKRGYRTEQGEAPLNEVLAAGMILKTGWRGESNFVDPMCGSGTLLIEAAMIALNIPPGLYRKEFGFERWPDFDSKLFEEISQDESGEREFAFKCYGSDISPKIIEMAENNIHNAGLSRYVELQTLPFQQYATAPDSGILVTNPPYGERISTNDIINLYAMIGERLKHVFMGYQAWILSYKEECFEKIALRPSQKFKLMNGSLVCEYRCYELFKGKNKDYKTALQDNKRFDRKEPRKTFTNAGANQRVRSNEESRKTSFTKRNDAKTFDRKEERKMLARDKGAYTPEANQRTRPNEDPRKTSFIKRNDAKTFDRKDERKTFSRDKGAYSPEANRRARPDKESRKTSFVKRNDAKTFDRKEKGKMFTRDKGAYTPEANLRTRPNREARKTFFKENDTHTPEKKTYRKTEKSFSKNKDAFSKKDYQSAKPYSGGKTTFRKK